MSYTFNKFITSDDAFDEIVKLAEVQIEKLNEEVKTLIVTDQQTSTNVTDLENKTMFIELPILADGTSFGTSNIYAEQFVKNGALKTDYLMGDGSILTSSANSGNSNFYLFNSVTSQTPTPTAGNISYNNTQVNATVIYVSHVTRDNLDVEIYYKNLSTINNVYVQDQNDSANFIEYNITAQPTLITGSHVEIPVELLNSGGTGTTGFSNGHNVLISYFTNLIETDQRLSALESKSRHQSATSLETQFNSPINMFNHKISNVADPTDLNDVSTKKYVDDTVVNLNTSIDALENKTQNITAPFLFRTVIDNGIQFKLRDGTGDLFIVTNDASPLQSLKFLVRQDTVQVNLPLIMGNENRIEELGAPVNPKDATTKSYVDTADALKLNLTGGTLTGSITATQFIRTGGSTTQFLKANGDVDGSTYITATNSVITDLQNKTQNVSASLIGTDFIRNTTVILRVADGDFFTVRNDATPFSVSKLNVSNTSVQINSVPLLMNNQRITLVGTPTQDGDAPNKLYVDNRISNLSNTYATLTQLSSVVGIVDTKLSLSGGLVNGNIVMQTGNLTIQTGGLTLSSTAGNFDMGNHLLVNVSTILINDAISIASGNAQDFMKSDGSTDTNRYLNVNGELPMTGALNMGNQNITSAGAITGTSFIKSGGLATQFLKANGDVDSNTYLSSATIANKLSIDGSIAMTGALNMGNQAINNSGTVSATSFIKSNGGGFAFRDFLKADGSVSTIQLLRGERLNTLYYNSATDTISNSMNMESWRYLSWGYTAGPTVSTVDCASGIMTNLGGSLTQFGISASSPMKSYKIRVGSNISSVTNGAICGWLGTPTQNFIYPRGGWYIKIGFSLEATLGTGNNRTMIGLYQSNSAPALNNTTSIAQIITGSMGIVQEKGETTFSFNSRGPTTSDKIPTNISCATPNNNWYTLEMINEPDTPFITLILTCQRPGLDTQTESTIFLCGLTNTMPIQQSWVHLQQSMASPGGLNGSAQISLGNITMKLAQ